MHTKNGFLSPSARFRARIGGGEIPLLKNRAGKTYLSSSSVFNFTSTWLTFLHPRPLTIGCCVKCWGLDRSLVEITIHNRIFQDKMNRNALKIHQNVVPYHTHTQVQVVQPNLTFLKEKILSISNFTFDTTLLHLLRNSRLIFPLKRETFPICRWVHNETVFSLN